MSGRRSNLSGTLRPDGRWEIRVTVTAPDGRSKRVSIYGSTQREVQTKASRLLHEQGRMAPVESTVADVAAIWWEEGRERWSDGTVRAYVAPKTRVLARFGSLHPSSITPPMVSGWLRALHLEGLGIRSVSLCRQVLRLILQTAVETGSARNLEAVAVRLPSASKPPPRARIESDEWRQVIEAETDPVLRSLWWLLGETGLRPFREAVPLTRDQLRTVADVWVVHVGGSKTAAGEGRMVPIPDELARILEPREGLLFPGMNGQALDPANVRRSWRRAVARAELPPRRLYDLRHLALSRWAVRGLDDLTLKTLAGHARISTTKEVYARLLKRDYVAALWGIEGVRMASPPPATPFDL